MEFELRAHSQREWIGDREVQTAQQTWGDVESEILMIQSERKRCSQMERTKIRRARA